jgi:hypothetical protein
MDDYITAERRGRDSLRRFLLDLDAKEANQAERWSLGAVLELYLRVNAHPHNEGGLAPSTYKRYESVIHVHLLGRPREEGVASHRYAQEDLTEWRAARDAQTGSEPSQTPPAAPHSEIANSRRNGVLGWLSVHKHGK